MSRNATARAAERNPLHDTIRTAAAELPADTIARIVAAVAPALAQPAANQPSIQPDAVEYYGSTQGLGYMANAQEEALERCLRQFSYLLCSITSALHEDRDTDWVDALCDIGGEWVMREQQKLEAFRPIQQAAITHSRRAAEKRQ
ncbi:hypothetical protein [Xanthomonas citri]|uniref:hypothetical protein n=1 Tax=Xanthomonas citri TaxID=346 RepID=UPI0002FB955F|nr:hypothetical protein [Xanthomonas citri]AMU99414.1 hypothetical protein TP37_15980 [Xanthomonas citri pv. aurantifolii]TBW93055.1 hypothetical protein TP49_22980 [Xanthomonas citri pv. aurantifolii]TBW97222.1 hypothetical protein TP47_11995 [Xanthomonas citri pv. aurantifolii]TBX05340.1 hypothetical protein TP46_00270 [Xanthomonas citri pv. aurantifolii]